MDTKVSQGQIFWYITVFTNKGACMHQAQQTHQTQPTQSTHELDKKKFKRFSVPTAMYDFDWATPSVIHIYSYMLNRYTFFKHSNKQYFESEAKIALFLNTTAKTVQRSIKVLKEHSFLDYELKHKGTSFSNVYTVNDVFGIYDDVVPKHGKKQSKQEDDYVPKWMQEDDVF